MCTLSVAHSQHIKQPCDFYAHRLCVLYMYACVHLWMCHSVSGIREIHNQLCCSFLISMTLLVVIRGIIALQDSCQTWGVEACRRLSVSFRFHFLRAEADVPSPTAHPCTNHTFKCSHAVCVQTQHTHIHIHLSPFCSTCPHYCAFLTLSHTNFCPLLYCSSMHITMHRATVLR